MLSQITLAESAETKINKLTSSSNITSFVKHNFVRNGFQSCLNYSPTLYAIGWTCPKEQFCLIPYRKTAWDGDHCKCIATQDLRQVTHYH